MSREQDEATVLRLITDEPPPARPALHDNGHAEGGHGGTEMGWLVSYADMMTLLFGLFVVLFSLAQDKSKSVEEVMKQVSDKYFATEGDRGDAKPTPTPPPVAPPMPDLTQEVQTLQTQLATLQQQIETERQQVLTERQQVQTERQQVEIERQQKKVQEENWQTERVALQTELQRLQATRTPAQVPPVPVPDTKPLVEKLRVLEKENQILKASVEQTKTDRTSVSAETQRLKMENARLNAEATKVKAENSVLAAAAEAAKTKTPTKNYVMILLTWESEKHDLDLRVIDPRQKTFDFKKRKIAGVPGQFEIDSRYGPGIEVWKAVDFTPGTYAAALSMYSTNGNETPARARLTVMTNLGTYNSEPLSFATKGTSRNVKFSVQADGSVSFAKP